MTRGAAGLALRSLSAAALMVVPAAAGAQEGTVAYRHSVRIDAELLEEARARFGGRLPGGRELPTERTNDVVVFFDAGASLMRPVPPSRDGRGGEDRPERAEAIERMRTAGRGGGRMGAIERMMSVRAARESLVEAHVDHEEGTSVERREFLGRTFLIEDRRPDLKWTLTGEQAEFLDRPVQKATTTHDGREIEAWFTFQIPVPSGPAGYGGLPGMILVLSIDGGQEQYSATEVSLGPVGDGVIVAPTEGEVVTREEYRRIVAEKLAELRRVGPGR